MQSVRQLRDPGRDETGGANWAAPRDVKSLDACFFYHMTDLSDGSVREGRWDLRGRFADYTGHVDFHGARVLDVGTASGFLSFSAEAAGAREVVSFDIDSATRQHLLPFRDSLYVRDYPAWVKIQTQAFEGWKNGYWYTHRDRGSRARAIYGDVYALPEGIGTFDVVILGAILEHLGDPVRAIGSIARVAADRIVINTDTIEGSEPMALFNGVVDRPDNNYIFWTYTVETYRRILAICGFEIETVHHDTFRAATEAQPIGGWILLPRTAIVARRIR